MDLDNPFKARSSDSADAAVSSNSIRIEPFRVRSAGFRCRVYSQDQVAEMLSKELATYCGEQGFEIVNGKAKYTIKGEIVRIEQGSRILRYIVPFLAGEAMVEIQGEVVEGAYSTRSFHVKRTFAMGAFGGSSRGMIKTGLRHAGMKIASDAGLVGQAGSGMTQGSSSSVGGFAGVSIGPINAWLYLGMVALAALVVAAIVGSYAHGWAMAAPERHDGIAMEHRGRYVLAQEVLAFLSILFGALAAAPESVLKSRTLIWLRSSAGVQSTIAQRIVLGILCAIPIFLAYMSKRLM